MKPCAARVVLSGRYQDESNRPAETRRGDLIREGEVAVQGRWDVQDKNSLSQPD